MRIQQLTVTKLLEGGNVEIGDLQANRIDAARRSEVVPIIDAALKAINASFAKSTGTPLWSPALIRSREYLSGSAFHFFNRAEISDAEFRQVKDTVGDIDTQVNRDQKSEIATWLGSLTPGAKLGPARYVGAKPSGEQFITLWQFPDIVMTDERTGREVSMNIQIDLELKEFQKGVPSAWSKFSASSAWADLSLGVKGVFHKYLIQSLAALTTRDFLLRKLVGRGSARSEQDVPMTDSMLSFAVSSREGGGLRVKYEPVLDEKTGKPIVKSGVPVLRARPTTEYEQNIPEIFARLFGKRLTPKQAQTLAPKFWSFSGLLDVFNQLLNDTEKQQVITSFVNKLFGAGAQGLYVNDPVRDSKEKSLALKVMLDRLGVPAPSDLKKIQADYVSAYKLREGIIEDAPDYRRVGIKHIYNPGSAAEMKDSEFLSLVSELAQNSGKLDGMDVNLKVDGAGIRFGRDAAGKPFMMTSRINTPLYAENIGDFERFSQSRDQTPEQQARAQAYDQALRVIVNSDFVKSLPRDTIVQAEMLFVPLAEKTPAGLKFVNIPYDASKLGKTMTLVPFSVKQFSTGEPVPNADAIKKSLISKSSSDVKFVDNQLKQSGIDVSKIIQPVLNMSAELKAALASRKPSAEKTQAREILAQARRELSEKIIKSPQIQGLDQLGKNIEGLVINLPSGALAKVTSPEMKQAMVAKTARPSQKPSRTAVVAIGSFVGHRGHQQLFDYTVKRAQQLGGDPYLFMGSAVGKDDPVPISDKVQTWRQLYPEYAKNISAVSVDGGSLMQKIKHELINPAPGRPPRYDNIIIMVGEDRKDMPIAAALMRAVNKFPGYEHVRAELEVTPRGTGMSFTQLRNSLRGSDTDAPFELWKQAFDGSAEFGSKKLPDSWIRHLMKVTKQGMGLQEEAAGVGRITAQNTTADVRPGETQRQAAKFGNRLDATGRPPLLHKTAGKNSNPNKMFNLAVSENYEKRNVTLNTQSVHKDAINMKKTPIRESAPRLGGIYQKAGEKLYVWESRTSNAVYLENANTGTIEQFAARSSVELEQFLVKKGYQLNQDISENMEVAWKQERKAVFEGLALDAESCDRDHEVQMARADLYRAAEYAMAVYKMLKNVPDDADLEGWVQAKITKASDYLASVKHYLEYEMISTGNIAVEQVAPITEAKRIVHKIDGKPYSAKVYYDNEWEEFVVHYFQDGRDLGEAPRSFHGKDKSDAISTANSEVARMNSAMTESSSVGGTSSGSVAAVIQPLGKVQKGTKKSGKKS
jgi:hypothetical protein